MVKLVLPQEVKIAVRPLKLVPSEDEYDRMSKMEWRFAVLDARTQVGRALNQFFYGGK